MKISEACSIHRLLSKIIKLPETSYIPIIGEVWKKHKQATFFQAYSQK